MKLSMSQICVFVCLLTFSVLAQEAHISFETNGKPIQDIANNPFAKFIGEWTLKHDKWTQNWGFGTETILIPNHHTIYTQINTSNSVLAIIDGPEPNGHIFWSYNPKTQDVYHLSSFGTRRAGNGEGTMNENGDLTLKLSFADETPNSYRIYTYQWVSENEYFMKSVQHDGNDKPTGLFYQGTFVRIMK